MTRLEALRLIVTRIPDDECVRTLVWRYREPDRGKLQIVTMTPRERADLFIARAMVRQQRDQDGEV